MNTTLTRSTTLQARPAADLIGARAECPSCAKRLLVAAFDEEHVWVECGCDFGPTPRGTYIVHNNPF